MLSGGKASIIDMQTLLKDSYAVTASAAGQVSSVNKIFDSSGSVAMTAGMDEPEFFAEVDIDVSAITSGVDHRFRICVQGSSSSSFASDIVNLGILELSTQTPIGGAIAGATGRFKLYISNRFNNNVRRYIRAYTDMSGTSSPSITYTMALSKPKRMSA